MCRWHPGHHLPGTLLWSVVPVLPPSLPPSLPRTSRLLPGFLLGGRQWGHCSEDGTRLAWPDQGDIGGNALLTRASWEP